MRLKATATLLALVLGAPVVFAAPATLLNDVLDLDDVNLSRADVVTVDPVAVPDLTAAMGGPGGGQGGGLSHEAVDIDLRLTGDAERTGSDSGSFTFYLNATGTGVRQTPNGNGVQVWAQGLEAQIVVVDGDGNELENYTALVKFHGSESSYLGQGLEGFRFNLQIVGQRSEAILLNTANPDGRVLAANAHGNTVGEPDEDGAFAIQGRGQTTTQPNGNGSGATHYNFILAGAGSITASEEG
jgi:hypothetical protein